MSESSTREKNRGTKDHAESERSGRKSVDSAASDAGTVDQRLEGLPHIEAFGHRYHASGKIFFPSDRAERERNEIQHRLFRLCLDGELTATRLPRDVGRIADLGTGTGVWAVEMAARYPQARIVGVDVYPMQRRKGVPPNVRFAVADVEDAWDGFAAADASLDFVHARGLAGGVRDWPALLRRARAKLRPGGLFEMTEIHMQVFDFDGKFAETEAFPGFLQLFRDLGARVGMEFNPSPLALDWLIDADFEKIVQRSEILPLGTWAGDEKLQARQALMNKIIADHLDNHCGLLFTKCGLDKADFEKKIPPLWEELRRLDKRPYITAIFTTARKPRE
ncbi:S-adenosyl-L-methionine-dependent methyltransferase [Durotheca rogersii]|uniref:S-adenosyl-L-methionine-dependent methyltransferase n=1 Tax=Durotheca rogersii TaxID=419775 RepID=UPI00221F2A3B|nr:S-adenosyl-L-methionine-dependent methyltransferase [Durotheca rogersii]KAI5867397.1 S-adenosyl-L-methionine-dependent methyltransferase [Durotheca rogersii]